MTRPPAIRAAFPSAPLTWVVIAVLPTGQGIGDCGHHHDTAEGLA